MRCLIISFLAVLLSVISVGCSFEGPALRLDEQVAQRKGMLAEHAHQFAMHAEMWSYVEEETHNLKASAASSQTQIAALLEGRALDAYRAERESFSQWYAYQDTISNNVIPDVWQTYVGGTEGETFQLEHLYDIANADATEQEILYNALSNKGIATIFSESASIEQLFSAKEHLVADIRVVQSGFDPEDNWRMIEHTPKQLETYLNHDLELFQKWLAARDSLVCSLNSNLRPLYASNSVYWISLCLDKYTNHFIEE